MFFPTFLKFEISLIVRALNDLSVKNNKLPGLQNTIQMNFEEVYSSI